MSSRFLSFDPATCALVAMGWLVAACDPSPYEPNDYDGLEVGVEYLDGTFQERPNQQGDYLVDVEVTLAFSNNWDDDIYLLPGFDLEAVDGSGSSDAGGDTDSSACNFGDGPPRPVCTITREGDESESPTPFLVSANRTSPGINYSGLCCVPSAFADQSYHFVTRIKGVSTSYDDHEIEFF